MPAIASTFTGNNGYDRQITTGFACKFVAVLDETGPTRAWMCWSALKEVEFAAAAAGMGTGELLLHATDGFIVDYDDLSGINTNARVYRYVAIG